MSATRIRRWLVLLALALGAGAALVGTPAPRHQAAPRTVYRPPSGC